MGGGLVVSGSERGSLSEEVFEERVAGWGVCVRCVPAEGSDRKRRKGKRMCCHSPLATLSPAIMNFSPFLFLNRNPNPLTAPLLLL